MIERIYLSAWMLTGVAVFNSVLTGGFDPAAMVTFSLVVLGLIYAFALWSVTFNMQGPQPHRVK